MLIYFVQSLKFELVAVWVCLELQLWDSGCFPMAVPQVSYWAVLYHLCQRPVGAGWGRQSWNQC